GPGKAVANWDEDALTMAVAAAIVCLDGVDRASVDGVLFASTSYAFKEKQGAAIIAKALDLRRDVLTADLGDSLRAGTNALRAAIDSIKAGSAKRVLVVIGDTRMAAPRSALEANLGDAGVAFLVGDSGAAFAPLQLVAALENARAGDKLLLVGYGDGADAFALEVAPGIEKLRDRRGVRWHLKRRGELPSYDMYMRFRQLLATEHDR